MRNFQKKYSLPQFLQSRLVLIFLAFILLFFAYNLLGMLGKMRETSKNRVVSEQKLAQLQASKEKLSEDIEKLSTKEGTEETIRDKFGLAKEGEGVIIIVEEKEDADDGKDENAGGFWNFIKNLFK